MTRGSQCRALTIASVRRIRSPLSSFSLGMPVRARRITASPAAPDCIPDEPLGKRPRSEEKGRTRDRIPGDWRGTRGSGCADTATKAGVGSQGEVGKCHQQRYAGVAAAIRANLSVQGPPWPALTLFWFILRRESSYVPFRRCCPALPSERGLVYGVYEAFGTSYFRRPPDAQMEALVTYTLADAPNPVSTR